MIGPVNEILSLVIGPFNNSSQVVQQVDFVIHYDNNTWNNNNGQDFHIPITNIQPFTLNLTAMLEGPFNGSMMSTNLSSLPDFPTSQPFQSSPWNYTGGENTAVVPSGVVDWVLD